MASFADALVSDVNVEAASQWALGGDIYSGLRGPHILHLGPFNAESEKKDIHLVPCSHTSALFPLLQASNRNPVFVHFEFGCCHWLLAE